ncbi:monocarboxylate transporter 12-like [Diadema antillarum]|uniref:monocarboxylate transporter 12-like n=1 Tax=Diadema antillarum TaxID=105358 RepID=UPI003A8642FD
MAKRQAVTRRGLATRDSTDPWRYVIVLAKFALMFLDAGLAKSFGVLLPEMVARYKTDYKTMAMICSMPATLMYFSAPLAHLLLRVVNARVLAVIGGFLSAVPLMCFPFIESVIPLALLTSAIGFGMSITVFPLFVAINDYYPTSFIFYNTLTLFGSTFGAFCLPVIVERSLEAYGQSGAFLILGGICLNAVACGAVVRPPMDRHELRRASATKMEQDELLVVEGSETLNQETELAQETETPSGCGRSLLDRLKSFVYVSEPMYTLATPAIFLTNYVLYAWMLFLVPQAEWLGIERSRAVFLSSIAGISGVFGRILFLVLIRFDWNPNLIFACCCLLCAVSFFILHLGTAFVYQAINSCVQGFVMFILDSTPHALLKKTVRREENVSVALACNSMMCGAGAICGDILSGHIFDVTKSYATVFVSLGVAQITALINLIITEVVDRTMRKRREKG